MFNVKVWDRREKFDPRKEEYQADILLPDGRDYHAIGDTPQQALLRLAVFWTERDGGKLSKLLQTIEETET